MLLKLYMYKSSYYGQPYNYIVMATPSTILHVKFQLLQDTSYPQFSSR